MKEFIFGNIRVQLLSESIIRVEYGKKGKFCDANTFFIPDRAAFSDEVECKAFGQYVVVGDYALSVAEGARGISGITLAKNGTTVYKVKKQQNSGELPPAGATPEVFAVYDNPRVTVPDGGYKYRGKKKNSGYKTEPDAQDAYLLICKKDAKKLRELYVALTGRVELVRLSTLGSWNSKYYEYSEKSAKGVISDYEKHKIPLDNMVIDTDWRLTSDRGIGYDINKELFPSMARFMNYAHSHGVEIMFNDHPEPVDGADSVLAPEEVKFRTEKLTSILKTGLDIWWYDRNWSTKLKSPVKGIEPETWGLYLFKEITEKYFEKLAGEGEPCRRPVIMGNVNNVENGVYRGIGDSASHRYSVQWTGDVGSFKDSLDREIANLIRCSSNCIAYVNADCGGHTQNPDKEMFVRWMQFGVLSPVFRPHCTKGLKRNREPWEYDGETVDIVRDLVNMRYRLLPLIYTKAYESYASGAPVFAGLGWEYPDDKRAVKCESEYMLGKNILIAPVTGHNIGESEKREKLASSAVSAEKEVYLPAGKWVDAFCGKVYAGGKTVTRAYSLREIPVFIRSGALIPLTEEFSNTHGYKLDKLVLDYYPNKDVADSGYIYEDDGETTAYKRGAFRKTGYSAKYAEHLNAFRIDLDGAKGVFGGERAVTSRKVTVRYHLAAGVNDVRKVTVNGQETAFWVVGKDSTKLPFGANGSPDGAVLEAVFDADVSKAYSIIITLG